MFLVKSGFKAWYRKSVVKILFSLKSGAYRATLKTNLNSRVIWETKLG